jgi:hypothetical protein
MWSGMAKDHGPSVKDDKQYEGLRKKGMSKSRAAAIANTPDASSKGGKKSRGRGGSSRSSKSSGAGSGGNRAQKQAAGRKGGKASS